MMSMQNITLRDIYDIVDRLERKVDGRMTNLEDRFSEIKSTQDQMLGKISIGMTIGMLVLSFAFTILSDIFKKVFGW